ncbi:glutamate-rich protein 6B-like [Salmo trutta]|uniref:glutamate-rich protein 6B-like n=1 Tax=Salmo trutta TaxID=8032 RepID=UPI001130410E|nr:glutamate-rich protein 6B-like [Salmo trutta]
MACFPLNKELKLTCVTPFAIDFQMRSGLQRRKTHSPKWKSLILQTLSHFMEKNKDIRVNLTQLGGSCCSDTGAMRRRWSWLDHEPHVHTPPFQPICLTLSPNISLRIQTQDCIYLTFTSRKRSVRFNVGAKLKLEHLKSLMLPGPDLDQRHLHMKSAEIYNLLQRMQGYITYQQAPSPQKVMPQYSLVSQMERLKTPLDKHHSVKKRVQIATKAK